MPDQDLHLRLERVAGRFSLSRGKWGASYFADALQALPIALLFALCWTYAAVHNVAVPFDLGQILPIQLGIMLLLFVLVSFPRFSLLGTAAFLLLAVASVFLPTPFLSSLKGLLSGGGEALLNVLRWSFKDTRGDLLQPPYYSKLLGALAAALTYLLVWRWPWPFLLSGFMLFPFLGSLGEVAKDPAMLLAMLGCLFTVAVVYTRRAKWNIRRAFFEIPPYLTIIPVLVLAFLLQSLLPIDAFQEPHLADRIRQFQKRLGAEDIVNYYEFSLRDAGYYPEFSNLGGPLILSHQLYMTVAGPRESFRLRGSVSEEYTGSLWIGEEMEPNYIFDNQASTGVQAATFAYPATQHLTDTEWQSLFRESNLRIDPVQSPVQVIFHGGRPRTILPQLAQPAGAETGSADTEMVCYFNDGGQIYANVQQTEPYTVSGWVGRERSAAALQASLSQGIQEGRLHLAAVPTGENSYETAIRQHDPELARILYDNVDRRSEASRLQAFLAARSYLAEHYTYTLEVAPSDPDQDFFTQFLQNKAGYCTYFATATTLLARELGIRARYVEGFLVPAANAESTAEGDELYSREVLTDNAHAWTEILVEGAGWLAVDATPADALGQMSGEQRETPSEPTEPNPEASSSQPQLSPQTTAPPDTRSTAPPEQQTTPRETPATSPGEAQRTPPPAWLKALLIALVVLLLLAFVAFILWRYLRQRFQRRHDLRHLQDLARASGERYLIALVWQDIKELAGLCGVHFAPYDTIFSAIQRLRRAFPRLAPELFSQSGMLLENSFFAEAASTPEALQAYLHLYAELEQIARDRLKKGRWLRQRYLLPGQAARELSR